MHTCPDCGQECYCHGDIDDCQVETEEYSSMHCTHYKSGECCQDEGYNDFEDCDEPPKPDA